MSTKCWDIRNKGDKVYSVNLEKGESQWGLPVSNDEVGWEKNQSRKDPRKIYYRNIKTREYQWEKPEPKKEPLEENWEERKSTLCNQIYYINTKENISKWEHPNESVTKLEQEAKKQKELNEKKAREQEEKRQKELNEKKAREQEEKKAREQDEKRQKDLIEKEQKKKKSDKAEKPDEMWPMSKMYLNLAYKQSIQVKKQKYAVLLTTGAMNPVHKGHLSLIDQSKLRLHKAGYEVVGAWLSPSHDLYLQPKAKNLKTIGLSAPFRVELIKHTVAIDSLIDVGLWESSLKLSGSDWGPSDYPFVCLSLKEQIEKEFDSKYGEITVFYTCGTDHAQKCGLYNGPHKWGGVVVVPREGETIGKENPDLKVYVAEPSKGDIASYSSTLIREAIVENKEDIIKKMMTKNAVRFLIHPTSEEYTKFSYDFDKLKKPVLLTKKEQLIDNNFQIPWIQTKGTFTLNNIDYKKSRTGNYVFDPSTLQLITNVTGSFVQTTTVMYTKCMVSAKEFKETSESIKPKITPIIGKIQTEIQKPSKRHKIFVLPSQLNAAEYVTDDTIITDVDLYKFDKTGGPMGQLSADPSVAQFIIDNACNENRRDKGINNVRLMGRINGIRLHNGYLKVQDTVDVEAFKEAIPNMTILGIKDIPVRGLDSVMENFVNMQHKVDLIYASAVPYGNLETGELTYGNSSHKNVRTIAKLSLFAQYVGSMRLAISRGDCELILMPLGGGFFKNVREDIKSAIISAYDYMEKELTASKVNVFLLLYDGSIDKDEINFFTK
jgi:flagellar biosynthesis GTPase FlhF